MTTPEACKLILQAAAVGEGGEIFILDMGTPIKIVDMAKDLIRRSGFKPEFNPEYYGGKHTNTPEYQSLAWSGNEKGYRERMVARPAPRAHKPKAFWEDGGATLMATLRKAVEATSITVHHETRALTLVKEGERVIGVLCRQDGKLRAWRARCGVVLCYGGFIMNKDMVRKYAPRLTVPHRSGIQRIRGAVS